MERGEAVGGVKECRGVESALVDQMEGLKGGVEDQRLLLPRIDVVGVAGELEEQGQGWRGSLGQTEPEEEEEEVGA